MVFSLLHPQSLRFVGGVFLRKDSYIPKIWSNFSLTHLSFGGFSWRKNKSKNKQSKNITIQLSKHDQENYIRNFLKKRILTTWKQLRCTIAIPSSYSESLEKQLYQRTYNELKPLLLASYKEDFNQPYSQFAFRSWLEYVKILAQITGKYHDARYWDELNNFITCCAQHNLVDL